MAAADSRYWHHSSRCDSGACVEVAITEATVFVRKSDQPGVELTFDREEWVEFLAAVKEGELTG
jgi:hypothetical protein